MVSFCYDYKMKLISDSSKEQAILEWLKAEMDSARFSNDLHIAIKKLGYDEEIVTQPDLNNKQENAMRWQILKSFRTWLDKDFGDYDWELVELDKDDVSNLNYIDYSYWNELSDNSRKVGRAAENIVNGKVVFEVPNDRFHLVANDFESGLDFDPIIVVSNHNDNQGEILEGHLRATGYVLSQQTQKPLKAIWGRLR